MLSADARWAATRVVLARSVDPMTARLRRSTIGIKTFTEPCADPALDKTESKMKTSIFDATANEMPAATSSELTEPSRLMIVLEMRSELLKKPTTDSPASLVLVIDTLDKVIVEPAEILLENTMALATTGAATEEMKLREKVNCELV